ncbi:hypothetical protein BAU14_08820 [Enterococcus sp. CU9D]|nr:hypothetical protein BAU14_08820 [Enterococcus sp. CU9D]
MVSRQVLSLLFISKNSVRAMLTFRKKTTLAVVFLYLSPMKQKGGKDEKRQVWTDNRQSQVVFRE